MFIKENYEAHTTIRISYIVQSLNFLILFNNINANQKLPENQSTEHI